MRVVREQNAAKFLERVRPLLVRKPAENNLMLGLLGDLATGRGADAPLLLAVESAHGLEAVALQTPPRALIVSRATGHAVEAIAEFVISTALHIPGVIAPLETAEHFASLFSRRTARAARLRMAERVYELSRVEPPRPPGGAFREAAPEDEATLARWVADFIEELRLDPIADDLAFVRAKLASHQLYVWEAEGPVSMVAWVGRTALGVRIAYVYTPPAHRQKGYARASVAALSQYMLDQGCPACFLFADSGNAVTNKMYQQLGYRFVCDYALYDFDEGGE